MITKAYFMINMIHKCRDVVLIITLVPAFGSLWMRADKGKKVEDGCEMAMSAIIEC